MPTLPKIKRSVGKGISRLLVYNPFKQDRETAVGPCESGKSNSPRLSSRLEDMPFDVIFEICMYLDPLAIQRLSHVSVTTRLHTTCLRIWQIKAEELMARGLRIELYSHTSPRDLTSSELRKSVLVSEAVERRWLKKLFVKPKRVSNVTLRRHKLDRFSYATQQFLSDRLIIPVEGGKLLAWDHESDRYLGEYVFGKDMTILAIDGYYEERSLFYIFGNEERIRQGTQSADIRIVKAVIPHSGSKEQVNFEEVASFVMPADAINEVYFLDPSQKMFCTVFPDPITQNACIAVIMNWEASFVSVLDLGQKYTLGRSVLDIYLSDDKQVLVLSEGGSCLTRREFSFMAIQDFSTMWEDGFTSVPTAVQVQPIKVLHVPWINDIDDLRDGQLRPFASWVLNVWWPVFPDTPSLRATIVLFYRNIGFHTEWKVVHNYSTSDGQLSGYRAVLSLRNPVCRPEEDFGLPVIGVSLTHLCWIEERQTTTTSKLRVERRKKRVMKVVKFPDFGKVVRQDHDLAHSANPLDIPQEILSKVQHVLIDSATGTITITTHPNGVHVFHFV